MRRLIIAGLAALALFSAPAAQADAKDFVAFLESHGEHAGNAEIAVAEVDLGYAICGLFEAAQDRSEVRASLLQNGHSARSASMWEVASVTHLCPDWGYLL